MPLLFVLVLWAGSPSFAETSKEAKAALTRLAAERASLQAQAADLLDKQQQLVKKLAAEVSDLESREDKLKKESDADQDAAGDLKEALNVVDASLFTRRFDLQQAKRKLDEDTTPAAAALNKKADALGPAIEDLKARVKKLESAEAQARRRAAEEAARRAAAAKAKAKPKPKLVASAPIQAAVQAAPAAAQPAGPKPYDAKPPAGMSIPAPPPTLDPDSKFAFKVVWSSACWFAWDPAASKLDIPKALRVGTTLLARAAAKKPAAPASVPAAADASTPNGAAAALPPPPTPEQKAYSAMSEAAYACRIGLVPYAAIEVGAEMYALYDAAGRGTLSDDPWTGLADAIWKDLQVGLWARTWPGCEPWAGRFWEPERPEDPAAFDEWAAAERVPTDLLKKTLAKLLKENPTSTNVKIYSRILEERETPTFKTPKAAAPAAPPEVPAKAPPPAAPKAAPTPVPAE